MKNRDNFDQIGTGEHDRHQAQFPLFFRTLIPSRQKPRDFASFRGAEHGVEILLILSHRQGRYKDDTWRLTIPEIQPICVKNTCQIPQCFLRRNASDFSRHFDHSQSRGSTGHVDQRGLAASRGTCKKNRGESGSVGTGTRQIGAEIGSESRFGGAVGSVGSPAVTLGTILNVKRGKKGNEGKSVDVGSADVGGGLRGKGTKWIRGRESASTDSATSEGDDRNDHR